jgi:hypothetical protein
MGGTKYNRKRVMGKDKKVGGGVAMEWQKDEAGKRGRGRD